MKMRSAWLLLTLNLVTVYRADCYGTISYVRPDAYSVIAGSFVSVDVKLTVLPEHATSFLARCGRLVGNPKAQEDENETCKFRIEQLDLRSSERGNSGGGLEVSSHVSLEMALDESRCDAAKTCALTVAMVDSNGQAVVPAQDQPLFVYLGETGAESDTSRSEPSIRVDQVAKKCFGVISTSSEKLGELHGDEWSRHARAVFAASASLRGHRMHSYAGHKSGPWLENHWLNYFSTNFESPQFGLFVPIFAQWVDVQFEADRRKVIHAMFFCHIE